MPIDTELENLISRSQASPQDIKFHNLAKVVSIAVTESDQLRGLIKSEALQQFDGDYDVLFSKIKDKAINGMALKDYLEAIYIRIGLGRGNTNSINSIDDLVLEYPNIQISCPVSADDWDEINYVPIVTFIPEDFNEGVTTTIEGFNNNQSIDVDAVTPPTEPVLVIGICERMSAPPPPMESPDVTIDLIASTSATGTTLLWTVDNPSGDFISGYRIYRKTLFQNNFTLLYDNIDKDNKVYNDNSVAALENYFYYVKAYNPMGESESSNIAEAVAPNVPPGLASFTADHLTQSEIELRWGHDPDHYIESTSVYERVVGVHTTYQPLGTFPLGVNEYFDNNITAGKKVLYKAVENNNQGSSLEPKYDFVVVPFRDVSSPSPVKIDRISYDNGGEIESWVRGRPEFRVAIMRGISSGDAVTVQENLEFQMDSDNQQFGSMVLNWQATDFLDVLTIRVLEIDGDNCCSEIVSAAFDKKDNTKQQVIKAAVNVILEEFTDSQHDEVGRAEFRYTDNPHKVIEFPRGGVKFHLID